MFQFSDQFFCHNNSLLIVLTAKSGGSQAVFFKMNTFGEESFLDCVRDAVRQFGGNG